MLYFIASQDMHLNGKKYEAVPDVMADYHNSYLITDEAEHLLEQEGERQSSASSADKQPFFMLFSPPLIHMPLIPDDTVMDLRSDELTHIKDSWRKKTAVMLIMLDNIVARLVKALEKAKLMDNTIIIFSSDNGGQVSVKQHQYLLLGAVYSEEVFVVALQCAGNHNGAGSNFPLRGCKGSLYEGSTRVPAFLFSHLLGHREGAMGQQFTSMFHVSDWLPTLVGGMLNRPDLLPTEDLLDGVDQWAWLLQTISENNQNTKSDSVKLSKSSSSSEVTAPRTSFVYNIDPISGVSALRSNQWKLILNESTATGWYNSTHFGSEQCTASGGQASNSVQLFDLVADEQERHDVAQQNPEVVSAMWAEIDKYIRYERSL